MVDTGASMTMLTALDLMKLGAQLPLLTHQLDTSRGIDLTIADGSTVRPPVVRCVITFPHIDGGYSMFLVYAGVLLDVASLRTACLLGMDILSSGFLRIHPRGSNSVEFDAPKATRAGEVIRVPSPWGEIP